MGLFDKFRKKVRKAAEEVDTESLSAEEGSEDAEQALSQHEEFSKLRTHVPAYKTQPGFDEEDDEWEDFDDDEELELPKNSEDEWDEWEEDESYTLPTRLTRKERKIIAKEAKKEASRKKAQQKEMKKRGAKEVKRLAGSKIDLHMMRTTTGRQLVEVKSSPSGGIGIIEDDGISIDLGGGVVESGGRVIKESDALNNLMEELEWIMLESDISSDAVTAVMTALKRNLIGQRLRRGADLSKVLEASLKRALRGILNAGYWDFYASIDSFIEKGDSPVVIMFVGVNGTGKTTTVAKVAHNLQNKGHSVIAAAGDTFRAGAIEQLETHCDRLGIRCVSSQRGGDSAAIARDAVESAKAKKIDVVLVDTAGRMQNKSNLMAELEKVRRVANPHLTLFVGDALAGNDAVDQAKNFQQMLKFDGAVLTKLDTDAKGGAGLSIAHATGQPIVLCGVGQEYDDLIQFDPDWLLEQLFE
ncbi:MAG: signal recognition particle-docking protein FtsY [Euryarchaeota archaeon]|nr:signal recognition particle-docking protein FtsY [Euryarchaeota archaeon]|tara:strand:- start:620 stop:2032 length:1413 start_codon:yes stop_codon:yes gene_type:complete